MVAVRFPDAKRPSVASHRNTRFSFAKEKEYVPIACSRYGDIVATHALLKGDQEAVGNTWTFGMLPFCEWGCNIYSCVKCDDLRVSTFEDFRIWPQKYSLHAFFEMWLERVDILLQDPSYEIIEREATNPFTGKKAT